MENPLNIGFGWALTSNKWTHSLHHVERLVGINLTDTLCFCLETYLFWFIKVESIFLDYMSEHTHFLRKYFWKMKVLSKIKIFKWFLCSKVLLNKNNLAK